MRVCDEPESNWKDIGEGVRKGEFLSIFWLHVENLVAFQIVATHVHKQILQKSNNELHYEHRERNLKTCVEQVENKIY